MENVIKDRIALLLKENNMSQAQLAKKTNLTEAAVSRYLNGSRVPKGAILLGIANALETTVDYLIGNSDVKNSFSTDEITQAFRLIARNAQVLTAEEKEKFAQILFTTRM